jgi:hypothetical protein
MSIKPFSDSVLKLGERVVKFQTESYGWLLAHRGMMVIIAKTMMENDPEFASKALASFDTFLGHVNEKGITGEMFVQARIRFKELLGSAASSSEPVKSAPQTTPSPKSKSKSLRRRVFESLESG